MTTKLNKIAIIVSICLSLSNADELIYNKQETIRKASIVYDKYTNKPITGIIVIRFTTGDVWRTIPYVDGKENGVERWYFKSNILRYEITNQNGFQNGITKEYDKNGKLISETMYKDDEEIK